LLILNIKDALDRSDLKKIWHGDVSRSTQPRQDIKFYAFKNSTWWPVAIWKIKKNMI